MYPVNSGSLQTDGARGCVDDGGACARDVRGETVMGEASRDAPDET